MSVLIKVNEKLWINPSHIIAVVDDGLSATPINIITVRNAPNDEYDFAVTSEEWAAIEPLVTLPARAAGCSQERENVTQQSLIARAVDEILAEEGCIGTVGCCGGPVGVQGDEYYFPSFDITEDDLPSQIDAAEREHPESIPDYSWLDNLPVEAAPPVDQEKLMAEFEAKQEADHAELLAQEQAGWLTPATDEELASQGGDSGDLFDDDEWDDDEDDQYYPY